MGKVLLAIGIIIVLAVVILVVVMKNKKQSTAIENTSQPISTQLQQDSKLNEENYKKLKELFAGYESSVSKVMEGFNRTNLLTSESDLSLRMSNGEVAENDKYAPKSVVEQIKKDPSLYNEIKTLFNEKGINQIAYLAKSHEVQFYIKAEKTPYVTNNNNLGTAFIYCKDQTCTKYGYQSLKENWYMWILPRPE